MSYNPYASPTSPVDAITTDRAGAPVFFPVSTFKLVVMSVCTLGLYEVYWFYMNWRIVRQRDRSSIWPVPRAIFGVFFCFSLFDRIRREGVARSVGDAPAMGPLAACWIVLTMLWKLPDPYSMVSLFAVVALIPVQRHANLINAKASPGLAENRRFSALNWVGIVLGGLLLLAAIVGMSMPEAGAGAV
jgi:hypothetical protein